MILGKRFAKLKRSICAESIFIELSSKKDGNHLPKLPRKLNMLFVLHVLKEDKVNKKALLCELDKYNHSVKPARIGQNQDKEEPL